MHVKVGRSTWEAEREVRFADLLLVKVDSDKLCKNYIFIPGEAAKQDQVVAQKGE